MLPIGWAVLTSSQKACLASRFVGFVMKSVSLTIRYPEPWGTMTKDRWKCLNGWFSLRTLSRKIPLKVTEISLSFPMGISKRQIDYFSINIFDREQKRMRGLKNLNLDRLLFKETFKRGMIFWSLRVSKFEMLYIRFFVWPKFKTWANFQ